MTEESTAANERRKLANPQGRERRFIKRLSEPHLRRNMQQIVLFSRIVLVFVAIYVCVVFASAFSRDVLGRTRSFFYIVAAIFFGSGLWLVERAAVSYMSNESVERLVIALEKMRNFFLVLLVLIVVFGTTHLISLF